MSSTVTNSEQLLLTAQAFTSVPSLPLGHIPDSHQPSGKRTPKRKATSCREG
jgi:hypothetical protein